MNQHATHELLTILKAEKNKKFNKNCDAKPKLDYPAMTVID